MPESRSVAGSSVSCVFWQFRVYSEHYSAYAEVYQPDPPGLIHDDLRLLPPWRGSSLFWGKNLRPPNPIGCGTVFSVCPPAAHPGSAVRNRSTGPTSSTIRELVMVPALR